MINKQLLAPKSIVVVGGSDDIHKPGGATLKNLINTNYSGDLYVVNPKSDMVQGVKSFRNVEDLPDVELAILAIAAKHCPSAVELLCNEKNCKAFIILSAGFHEESEEGAQLEERIVNTINSVGGSLIGPNCIGVMTPVYAGAFTQPVPKLAPKGVDLISGSGATIVYLLEAAQQFGLTFSNIFSVGNSAQLGVEDVLEYLDNNYTKDSSAPVKLLYIESINNPNKLLKHARSLVKKGVKIAAIKAGYSEAGSRAASSHTGALASPDKAVDALFRKAGIIRCYGRTELVTVAAAMMYPKPQGKKMAVITHAGGPAVMLTDVFSENGVDVPHIKGPAADKLLEKLFHGSSVANPIDFLATGTAEQLSQILDACENEFDVDGAAVIFGNPGLNTVYDVYEVLLDRIPKAKKPIYPILPSIVNAKDEVEMFRQRGGISFPDEVIFGSAASKIINDKGAINEDDLPPVDYTMIRKVIDNAPNGYLPPEKVQVLLDAAGISRAKEIVTDNVERAKKVGTEIGFPLVMKVVGPIHKSDVGGVALGISDVNTLVMEFNRMMQIPDTTAILFQPMLTGTQLFIGAKREGDFGHLVLCGLGGIFVEVLQDISTSLSPVTKQEAVEMITSLKGYKMIQGTRGQEGVNESLFNETIRRVSALCKAAPEIFEMDINPLMAHKKQLVAVDARIRIERD